MKKFGAYKIVSEKINECNFSSYAVGFDLNNSGDLEYRINALVKLLIKVVPEFAFGHHIGEEIALEDATNIVFESANAIYKIKDFRENMKDNLLWVIPYLMLYYSMNYGFIIIPWKSNISWGIIITFLFLVQFTLNIISHPKSKK